MNAPVRSKVFQTGNSVAVRLPKSFGFAADAEIEIEQRGREVIIRSVSDPDAERRKVIELVEALRAIPAPGVLGDRESERMEFPDRPGLY